MQGWIIPPPKEPSKSSNELRQERERKVEWLQKHGYLRSQAIKRAMLKVAREHFIPPQYRDYAYEEVPFPLPGSRATASCPHSYPLFYESLGLDEGQRFLEVGLGSGYGAALAREIVGSRGLVVSIEIDPVTYEFARTNLVQAGYRDIIMILGDGGLGYVDQAPYDTICVTAACSEIPPPLLDQLKDRGRLIAPVEEGGIQKLVMIAKYEDELTRKVICEVLYVPLQGRYR